MSIYRLGSDAWENILFYFDVPTILRLLLTGDNTLRTILKPAIRDFVLCIDSATSPSLSSLLNFVKRTCTTPRRLSLSLGTWNEYLRFASEDYTAEKWKSLFPETLTTLEIALQCKEPPFSSLLSSLAILAPRLTTLYIQDVPERLSLPQTLIFLEIDVPDDWVQRTTDVEHPAFFETLPPTLTYLKFSPKIFIKHKIEATNLPFAKMPLNLFHGNITFSSLTKEQACWSILPNSVVDLSAELCYGEDAVFFENPTKRTWKQLFPNLTRLNVPLESLADHSITKDLYTALEEGITDEQIKSIGASFPASLTAINLVTPRSLRLHSDLPLVIGAIGEQIRTFEFEGSLSFARVLEWLPKWENPKIRLLKQVLSSNSSETVIAEHENFETFVSDKEHPIYLLCANATSLDPGKLPASILSFLPRTLTSINYETAVQEPLCVASATKAFERGISNYKNVVHDVNKQRDQKFDPQLGWTALGWPQKLKTVNITLNGDQSLHLGCFPPTIQDLSLNVWDSVGFTFEGGDLAHLTELSNLSISSFSTPLITSLNGLPSSLRSLIAKGKPFSDDVVLNPALQNYFPNLERLNFAGYEVSPDVLLHLPSTLKALYIKLGQFRFGACLAEKHFEKISNLKLARLMLLGPAIWPEDLSFDVFSRYLPKSLVFFTLSLSDLNDKGSEEIIAPHIPLTLLSFHSRSSMLTNLVKERIKKSKSSQASN